VNLDGFYDPLLALFENMFKERFISRDLEKSWVVVKSIDELIEKLKLIV
jgi:predicted Rossmann-fold nucleotide-binding protein